jgi:GNAT superfamily N-acetyltransferase
MIDDTELLHRAVLGFGEMVAALGRWGVDPDTVIRRPDLLGARIDTVGDLPWFNAAVVPADATPPEDDPSLPYCVWSLAEAVPGRAVDPDYVLPCMGLRFEDPALALGGPLVETEKPGWEAFGLVNEHAYEAPDIFVPLIRDLQDARFTPYGLRRDGVFVCVAMTLVRGDDVCLHYVATEPAWQRQGLATKLLRTLLARARAQGLRTATLQASPDGQGVYESLGFRHLGTMRAFVRARV